MSNADISIAIKRLNLLYHEAAAPILQDFSMKIPANHQPKQIPPIIGAS